VIKATDFEYRHQTLLHLLVVGLAIGTYFVSRDERRRGGAFGFPFACPRSPQSAIKWLWCAGSRGDVERGLSAGSFEVGACGEHDRFHANAEGPSR
jgi:hypothetical protein